MALVRRYYLSEIIGTGKHDDEFRPLVGEHSRTWGMLDLRPDSMKRDGWVIAYADTDIVITDPRVKLIAEDLSKDAISKVIESAWMINLEKMLLPDVLAELLIGDQRTGFCKPLRAGADRKRRIILGGQVIYGPPLPNYGKGTITESFNTSDSDTLGPDLTWVEDNGDIDIVSNQAKSQGVTWGRKSAYADESQPTTADHYSQAKIWLVGDPAQIGVAARYEAGGQYDCYVFSADANTDRFYLRKIVNTSLTTISSTVTNFTDPAGDTYRLEVSGSTLTGKENGTQRISDTDTDIIDNTHCGIIAWADDQIWDDFEAGDLGWSNIAKVNGVTATDLAKVRGIAVASIAKRRGVAV